MTSPSPIWRGRAATTDAVFPLEASPEDRRDILQDFIRAHDAASPDAGAPVD